MNRQTSEEVLGVASREYEDTHSKDNSSHVIEAFAQLKLIPFQFQRLLLIIPKRHSIQHELSMVNQLVPTAIILKIGKKRK